MCSSDLGWNLLAELNGTNNAVIRSYLWGSDLSGTIQGAGGVGGLLEVTYNGAQTTNCFVGFDGNGNVAALADAAGTNILAQYDYGPFGEVIRATGPMAKANPFRFSSKYQDDETDLLYYGHRYYNASMGRWINRDPVEEDGFDLLRQDDLLVVAPENTGKFNQYVLLGNGPLNDIDLLGLCGGVGGPPNCGKDVTIDVILTRLNIRRTWEFASRWQHFKALREMFDPPFAFNSWDIHWLKANTDFGGSSPNCTDTVTFQSYCANKDELNYVMYGWGIVLGEEPAKMMLRRLDRGLWLRHSDSSAVRARKVGFATLGAGLRTMKADLAWPASCALRIDMYYPVDITEWKWDGLK